MRFVSKTPGAAACLYLALFSLSAQQPNPAILKKDIVYSHANGGDLKLDLAVPAEGAGPFPVILYFHGGGWQAGDKKDGASHLRNFPAHGYAAASVQYRFAPQYKWPAPVEDAKTAIRFLRSKAAEFRLDPKKFAVLGDSAGGYLAFMAGYTSPSDGLDSAEYSGQSSRVQAVVSFVSAVDFQTLSGPKTLQLDPETEELTRKFYKREPSEVMQIIDDFLGIKNGDRSDPALKRKGVLTYIDPGDPPTLAFYGEIDPLVPKQHAEKLEAALTKAGVRHEVVVVPGEKHGWPAPKMRESYAKVYRFLDGILK